MRLLFVDESGISVNEHILVVAGVIIHADKDLLRVESCIDDLVREFVREEDRPGFIFHATDLFHGSGKIFGDRARYPLGRSRQALRAMLQLPALFQLPIVFGFIRKPPPNPSHSRKVCRDELALIHGQTFTFCAIAAEGVMRAKFPHEVATITAEDNTHTKKQVSFMHDVLRSHNPELTEFLRRRSTTLHLQPNFLPLRKLRHSVHFTAKRGAPLLQLADACAFVIRCWLQEKSGMDELFTAFSSGREERDTFGDIEQIRSHGGGLRWINWLVEPRKNESTV